MYVGIPSLLHWHGLLYVRLIQAVVVDDNDDDG